mgnify:CR=1 FL=1
MILILKILFKVWAATLATRAREEGRIRDDFSLKAIIHTLNNIQDSSGALMCLSFVCKWKFLLKLN